MARSTKESTIRRSLDATAYDFTNETINRLMDEGDTLFLVQGSFGRIPILADTAEEAKDAYVKKFAKQIKAEEEDSEFQSQI